MGILEANPIVPARAPVVPRGSVVDAGGEILPIETHVRALLAKHRVIAIRGPRGSGKTMALAHLAATLADLEIDYVDESADLYTAMVAARPTVIALKPIGEHRHEATLELAPWGESERIDYLLAEHPTQVRSVMERLRDCDWAGDLEGSPRLWTAVLQRMAKEPTLIDVPGMLRQVMNTVLGMFGEDATKTRVKMARLARSHSSFTFGLPAFLQHPYMLRLALVDELLESIDAVPASDWWRQLWDEQVLNAVARRVQNDPEATERLRARLLKCSRTIPNDISVQGPLVSVMLAVEPTYRPTANLENLDRIRAPRVRWAGIQLGGDSLAYADLRGADLTQADLTAVNASGIDLRQANLCDAKIADARLTDAKLDEASFVRSNLSHTNLRRASAIIANFNNASLTDADLRGADVRGASFRFANLRGCVLIGASLSATDFTSANLVRATCLNCDWRDSILDDACFDRARLDHAIFADMHIETLHARQANFVRTDLTGLRLRRAKLVGSSFRQAGLAEIDWEGADLRKCDFTYAAFHMGSSRSGLVDSPIACEGSRTGFYTDDYADQEYKPAEAIRKANLCGANLLGAKVTGTDWYLVDLRGAKYSADQADWFRKCGAIMIDRAR